jgi:hypothetical protein
MGMLVLLAVAMPVKLAGHFMSAREIPFSLHNRIFVRIFPSSPFMRIAKSAGKMR